MKNEKQIKNQNNVNSINIKKISTLTKIHFIFGIIVFLFWVGIFILSLVEKPGLGFIIFIPFFYANIAFFFVSVIISISILVEGKNKKVKVLNIISTILISTILIILYPINYLKENIYDKYLKSPTLCEKEKDNNSKDVCYYNMAKLKKDINICYYMDYNLNLRDYCYRATARNIDDCKKIHDEEIKRPCLMKFQ